MHPAESLIKFWSGMNFDEAPYMHPNDHDVLFGRRYAKKINTAVPRTPEAWLSASRDNRIQLSLLPKPYIGDLRRAKIVICLTNPGVSIADFHAEQKVPEYRESIVSQIRQERLDELDYPFFMLNPIFCWSSAYQWWMRKLQRLTQTLVDESFAPDFQEASVALSRKIAAIEIFPYHSKSFNVARALHELPSSTAARLFVRDMAKLGKIVIIMRSVAHWDLGDINEPGLLKSDPAEARSASLGPNTKAGKAILAAFAKTSAGCRKRSIR